MKVVNKQPPVYRLKNVGIAHSFRFQDTVAYGPDLWMRADNKALFRAVNLVNGTIATFHPEVAVTPVSAEIVEL